MIVYVTIGNSDDKLTQREWSSFVSHVCGVLYPTDPYDPETRIDGHAVYEIHGQWFSDSASAYQNAAWCIEINPELAPTLKAELGHLAHQFRQDSIAWAQARTEFIPAAA